MRWSVVLQRRVSAGQVEQMVRTNTTVMFVWKTLSKAVVVIVAINWRWWR